MKRINISHAGIILIAIICSGCASSGLSVEYFKHTHFALIQFHILLSVLLVNECCGYLVAPESCGFLVNC